VIYADRQDKISIAIITKGGFHFTLTQKPIHQNESFLSSVDEMNIKMLVI
jgi:hypothetical protein